MIKAVFIDIDGTLLDFEACVEESMRVGLTENGIEYKPEMLEAYQPDIVIFEAVERFSHTLSTPLS